MNLTVTKDFPPTENLCARPNVALAPALDQRGAPAHATWVLDLVVSDQQKDLAFRV
jgi:hypothetical protein